MPKVFLSYNRKDEAFVQELYRRLKRDGVDCFFDKESIQWGENWVLALERGIDECDQFVPVLSPEFCDSEWITIERTSAMIEDPSGVRGRVRPLLLRECPDRPRFLKPIQHIDVSTTEQFEQNYPKICTALGGALTPDTEPQRGTLPPVRALPAKHHMPHRSLTDRFVGRVEDLWKLHDLLFQSEVAIVQGVGVVAGTGGLGKTQLAIEYARRFGYKYGGGVYWVDADQGLGTLIAQVSEAAGVEVDGRAPLEKQLEQLWHGLHSPLLSLVVLDNFPEELPEEAPRLESYLPTSGQVQTLVTTRRKDLDRHPGLNLDCLSPDDALALLNSGPRQFGAEADKLLEALGRLPLPIELTRGYLNRRKDATSAALVEEMQRAGEMPVLAEFAKQYGDQLPSGHERNVAATFEMSWQLLEDSEVRTLAAIAELAPYPVPRRLLRAILELSEVSVLSDPLQQALAELERLSLVELDEDQEPSVHRLLRSFVRHVSPERSRVRVRVAEAVSDEMARTTEETDQAAYRELEAVVPHAEEVARGELEQDPGTRIELLNCVGWHHKRHGRYRLAEAARRHALVSAEQVYEAGRPEIATSQSNLAVVLKDLGEPEEARDLLRQALASAEASYEPGHPSIARRQSNLALVLKDLGELEEARDLLRQAHQTLIEKLGAEHRHTKTVLNNLRGVEGQAAGEG